MVTPETLAGHANRPVSATAAGPFHHQSAGAGSPSKDPERPKRPLSATTRNTPLSTYYQVDNVASVPVAAAIFSDPLDNFGMSGAIATTPLTSASSLPPEIRAHLQKDPASYIAPGADSGVFKIGDRVQGLFQGGPNWYNGTVQSYDAVTGSYAVSYDDGDFEGDVPLARLRAISAAVEAAPVKTHVAVPTLAPAPASHPALVGGAHNFFKPKSQPAPIAVSTLSSPYKVGDKVEALYYKGTTWYGGKVQAVHTVLNTAEEEYAFDIAYDDGDRELKVPQASVRFPAGSANAAAAATTAAATANTANKQPEPASSAASTSSAVPPSPRPPAQFRAGDHVEGFYGGGPSWYGAKVSKVNPLSADGKYTYLLDYNDGDRETAVLEAHIRHVTKAQHQQQSPRSPKAASTAAVAAPSSSTSTSTYKKGDRVQGFFQEYDAWYDGTVDVMNGDGTYHVKYDDGDEDSAAHIAKLRAAPHTTTTHPASPAKAAPASASANATSKFKVDDRVEGLFGGANEWYPAIVSAVERVGASFCYSLHYDDGDREEGVDEALVRALSSRSPQHAALPATAAPFSGALSPKAAADNTNAPSSSQPAARKASIVNTNLDSFLNDLSDDEEESTGGNLDAGKGMMLGGQPAAGSALEMQTRSMDDDGDGYDEDFDA